MIILLGILCFLVGLFVSHHYIVVPLWETESELRKELKAVREELWYAKMRAGDSFVVQWADRTIEFVTHPTHTPESKVPHRAHSDVLYIPHPEDLLK